MAFEVFIKIGKNLISRGEVFASSGIDAAKEAAYLLDRKTIGVRPAYSEVQPTVHVFKTVPIPA